MVKWIKRLLGKESKEDMETALLKLKDEAKQCEYNVQASIGIANANANIYSELLWSKVWNYRDELREINKKIEALELRINDKIEGS